jgi:hypothetical protein
VFVMSGTIRVRTAAWFATAVVLSVFATVLVMQEWRADAAPGDTDATWIAVEPCRLFDYRPGEEPAGGKKTPLVAGSPATQQVTGPVGNCSIPDVGVVAVSMNVTVVQGSAQSNLRLYPADAAKEPVVSNLNWKAGDSATANKVDVKLSATGAVKLAVAKGTVNVIGDVVGFYTDSSLKELAATAGTPGPAGPDGPTGPAGVIGDITMTHGMGPTQPNVSAPPKAIKVRYDSVEVVSSGSSNDAVLPLHGPATIGGNSYKLISVEYCINPDTGTKVNTVYVDSNNPVDFASDLTDRTATGCYVVDTSALAAAQGYHVTFRTAGAVDTSVDFEGVQSTWTKV